MKTMPVELPNFSEMTLEEATKELDRIAGEPSFAEATDDPAIFHRHKTCSMLAEWLYDLSRARVAIQGAKEALSGARN